MNSRTQHSMAELRAFAATVQAKITDDQNKDLQFRNSSNEH
jgi:hypothetical protein